MLLFHLQSEDGRFYCGSSDDLRVCDFGDVPGVYTQEQVDLIVDAGQPVVIGTPCGICRKVSVGRGRYCTVTMLHIPALGTKFIVGTLYLHGLLASESFDGYGDESLEMAYESMLCTLCCKAFGNKNKTRRSRRRGVNIFGREVLKTFNPSQYVWLEDGTFEYRRQGSYLYSAVRR